MRVFYVEDDPISQDFVRKVLQAQDDDVETFFRARDLMNALRQREPDVMLIDYKLPDGTDGLVLARQIRKRYPQMVLIMVSLYAERQNITEAFRLGVDNFIVKPIEARELIQCIGNGFLSRQVEATGADLGSRHLGPLELDLSGRTATWYGQPIHLTRVEFNILALLTSRPGRVFNYPELYALNKGEHLTPPQARIKLKTHITNLRRKLEQEHRYPQAIHNVRAVGFKWQVLRAAEGTTTPMGEGQPDNPSGPISPDIIPEPSPWPRVDRQSGDSAAIP